MTLDDVPADKIMTLTDELDRLFKAAGCQPQCHACSADIWEGEDFQLLSFHGIDEMLCEHCDREDLERVKLEKEERRIQLMRMFPPRSGPGYPSRGGYSRPTVHGSQDTTG